MFMANHKYTKIHAKVFMAIFYIKQIMFLFQDAFIVKQVN